MVMMDAVTVVGDLFGEKQVVKSSARANTPMQKSDRAKLGGDAEQLKVQMVAFWGGGADLATRSAIALNSHSILWAENKKRRRPQQFFSLHETKNRQSYLDS